MSIKAGVMNSSDAPTSGATDVSLDSELLMIWKRLGRNDSHNVPLRVITGGPIGDVLVTRQPLPGTDGSWCVSLGSSRGPRTGPGRIGPWAFRPRASEEAETGGTQRSVSSRSGPGGTAAALEGAMGTAGPHARERAERLTG